MHIDQANIINLTGLWEKYGSRTIVTDPPLTLHANTHWPHRCWLDRDSLLTGDNPQVLMDDASGNRWLDNVPDSAIYSQLPMFSANKNGDAELIQARPFELQLRQKNWRCVFEQTAMYLDLNDFKQYSLAGRAGFKISRVRTSEDVALWIDICGEAFGYSIERVVIEQLIDDQEIQLLLGFQDGQAVASALLYKTGDVIGLHQVGVKQACQGQGIATSLMQEILTACVLWQGEFMVLQASQAGHPLYDSLGFRAQFKIKNYHRVSLTAR